MRLFLLFLFAVLHLLPAADPKYKALEIGVAAPDFNLKGVDGKMHKLGDYKAKVLAIVFNCNHCPTAQAYEPRMIKMAEDYKDKDFQLLVISSADPKAVRINELGYSLIDDGYEAMVQRSKDMKYNFPYLYDGDTQSVSKAYGPRCTPHIFIFGADRKLQYQGRIDNNERAEPTKREAFDAIDEMLAGKEVTVKTTRAFGCSTKWGYKRDAVKKFNEDWKKKEVTVEVIDEAGLKKLVKNETDKIKIINVWSTYCAPCVAELPHLIEIGRQFEYRRVELVTLCADSPKEKKKVLTLLQEENAAITDRIQKTMEKEGRKTNNYIIGEDDKDIYMDAIDKKWDGPLPHTMVVLPGGKVLYRHTGEIDPAELRKVLIKHLGHTYK